MQIIAGNARNIILDMPDGDSIRATPVRSRKALFDSIAVFKDKTVVDLFAGSGALGLESASRGAGRVVFVEQNSLHCRLIEKNMAKVSRAGVTAELKLICGNALVTENYSGVIASPDYVFADPPYRESGECFRSLINNANFRVWLNNGVLIWEIPDFGDPDGAFLPDKNWRFVRRKYGSREFIQGSVIR